MSAVSRSLPDERFRSAVPTVLMVLAVTVPSLLAFNLPPSPTLLNQVASIGLWGSVIAWSMANEEGSCTVAPSLLLVVVPLIVLAAGVLLSWWGGSLPMGLALSALSLIAAGTGSVAAGARATARSAGGQGFFIAWVIAGLFSACIALFQVFAPDVVDGEAIARSGLIGRAVGNLRQPNHLSSLLLCSAVSIVPLMESRWLPRMFGMALFAWFVFAVELSASRTGMVAVAILAAWGAADRRLSRTARIVLIAAPLIYGMGWGGMSMWAKHGRHTFGAAARLSETDISSSRFGIWSNTADLIHRAPWTGVGFGEFNFAWTLTPFPHRPTAFFDHTHNLPLQLLVELGVPLGGFLILMLMLALWRAWRNSITMQGDAGSRARSAFVIVLLMALHSQLEYPLWYAYFLLPTAWAWGYCLQNHAVGRVTRSGPDWWSRTWRCVGGLLIVGSIGAVVDYVRVSRIFEPSDNAEPLAERIAKGQRSVFFAHHADYAAVTTVDHPSQAWDAFKRAPHYLLDTRLMMAWAKAFAERGDLERARHIAQRLREFHNPQSDEFFAVCDDLEAGQERPFQCDPPSKAMDWRDFRNLP